MGEAEELLRTHENQLQTDHFDRTLIVLVHHNLVQVVEVAFSQLAQVQLGQ